MRKAFVVQRLSDGSNSSVHHIRRRDDIRAGSRLRHGLLAQIIHRLVVQNHPIRSNHTIVPQRVVRIQRHVRVHLQIRKRILQQRNRSLRQTLRIKRFLPARRLQTIRTWHRANRNVLVAFVVDENRINEVIRR